MGSSVIFLRRGGVCSSAAAWAEKSRVGVIVLTSISLDAAGSARGCRIIVDRSDCRATCENNNAIF